MERYTMFLKFSPTIKAVLNDAELSRKLTKFLRSWKEEEAEFQLKDGKKVAVKKLTLK